MKDEGILDFGLGILDFVVSSPRPDFGREPQSSELGTKAVERSESKIGNLKSKIGKG